GGSMLLSQRLPGVASACHSLEVAWALRQPSTEMLLLSRSVARHRFRRSERSDVVLAKTSATEELEWSLWDKKTYDSSHKEPLPPYNASNSTPGVDSNPDNEDSVKGQTFTTTTFSTTSNVTTTTAAAPNNSSSPLADNSSNSSSATNSSNSSR
ncbi:unnamed protein product, partial [Polarella glacialis]